MKWYLLGLIGLTGLTIYLIIYLIIYLMPNPPLGAVKAIESEIPTLEDEYFSSKGRYLQVLFNNELPEYEKALNPNKTVRALLGKDLPNTCKVDVFENTSRMILKGSSKFGFNVTCASSATTTP